MIDKKISIVTIHDVNHSCSEKLQKITDDLNKLNIKYNLNIVPNSKKTFNLEDNHAFCKQILKILQDQKGMVEITLHGLF